MCGMQALPYEGYLAREANDAGPYASMDRPVAPLIAPEYGERTIQLDAAFATVPMKLNAVPHVANAARSIAKKADNALWFGSVGDLTISSRFITVLQKI